MARTDAVFIPVCNPRATPVVLHDDWWWGGGPAPSPFGRVPCLGEPSSSLIPARDAAALLSKLDVVINLETRPNVRDATSEGPFSGTCGSEADTDLVL